MSRKKGFVKKLLTYKKMHLKENQHMNNSRSYQILLITRLLMNVKEILRHLKLNHSSSIRIRRHSLMREKPFLRSKDADIRRKRTLRILVKSTRRTIPELDKLNVLLMMIYTIRRNTFHLSFESKLKKNVVPKNIWVSERKISMNSKDFVSILIL